MRKSHHATASPIGNIEVQDMRPDPVLTLDLHSCLVDNLRPACKLLGESLPVLGLFHMRNGCNSADGVYMHTLCSVLETEFTPQASPTVTWMPLHPLLISSYALCILLKHRDFFFPISPKITLLSNASPSPGLLVVPSYSAQ